MGSDKLKTGYRASRPTNVYLSSPRQIIAILSPKPVHFFPQAAATCTFWKRRQGAGKLLTIRWEVRLVRSFL